MKYLMYRTARRRQGCVVRVRATTFETKSIASSTPIASFRVTTRQTTHLLRGPVLSICCPLFRGRQTTEKDVANQDLVVRMIRMCVGLISGQKAPAQGHKICFIKLVTTYLGSRL